MKERKKRSAVWSIPLNTFKEIVKNSNTFSAIMRDIGLQNKGGNINTLKRRIKYENIEIDHISQGLGSNKGRTFIRECIPYNKLFVENCPHGRNTLKKYIIKHKLIEYKCSYCGLNGEWNSKPMVLILDHINGISDDNRIENLRFLCPNCNSQTDTFAGRNTIGRGFNQLCVICGKKITKNAKKCLYCLGVDKQKFKYSKEELLKDIQQMSMVEVGKKYGVSDNAIRKICKKLNILHLRKNKIERKSFGVSN